MNRRQRQPQYSMRKEEWKYIAQLTIACWPAWGLGLVIGFIWLLCI
jgi:hypothetical protein